MADARAATGLQKRDDEFGRRLVHISQALHVPRDDPRPDRARDLPTGLGHQAEIVPLSEVLVEHPEPGFLHLAAGQKVVPVPPEDRLAGEVPQEGILLFSHFPD